MSGPGNCLASGELDRPPGHRGHHLVAVADPGAGRGASRRGPAGPVRVLGPRRHPAQPARRPHPAAPESLQQATADRLAYDRLVGALGRYSLVTVSHDSLAVHRLVQAWVRAGLDRQAQQHWAAVAVRLVWAAFPLDSGDVQAWPTCARLLPHALAAADHASRLAADPETTADLLTRAGVYLWWRAEHGRRGSSSSAPWPSSRPGSVPTTRSWPHPEQPRERAPRPWGTTAARTHYQRAQAIFEARLGPDHPDVARSLNNLAATMGALARCPPPRRPPARPGHPGDPARPRPPRHGQQPR